MNVTHTISTLEFARFLISLLGTFLLGFGIYDCYWDLIAIWKSGLNGFREYAAKTVLMLAVVIWLAQLTILGFVVIAMTQVNVHRVGSASYAATSLSILMSLIFIFIGAFGNYRKREFLLMIEDELRKGESSHGSENRP